MSGKLNQISRLVLLFVVFLLGFDPASAQKNETPDKSPHTSGFVTANGIKMQYLDWGGKGDVLLLLAGLGNDAHVFDDFAPKFTDRFRVIGLTRRGFGESDKPPTGYDTATRVEDIRRFLDQMKIKKVSLIGHSMAGDEMTVFASLYPKRVRKLVFLDAAYDRADSTKLLFADPYIPPLFKRIGLDAINSPQAAEVVVPVMPPPEIYKIFVAYYKVMIAFHIDYTKVKAPALAFFAVTEQPHPAITPQTDEETRKKLSDWVKENLTPLNRKSIEQFRNEMRHGQIIEMKDATHYIFLGKTADEVVRQTREFLLAKEYGWFEYLPKEKVIVSVDRKISDSYAGQYEIAPNFFLTITNENGKLMSQMTGQPKSELFAESETEFFLKESETEIKFVKNANGAVTELFSRERERDTFIQKIR